jgi:hypothetical protein
MTPDYDPCRPEWRADPYHAYHTTAAQHGHDAAPVPIDATAAATSPSVVRAEIAAPRGALVAPDEALEPVGDREIALPR